jgi:hypothetical protein
MPTSEKPTSVRSNSLDTTLSRAKHRAEHELKDPGAITGLHAAFARLGDLEDHAIDTGDLDAEQTTAEVRRVLASGRYRPRWS